MGRVAQLTEIPCEPMTVDSHVTVIRPDLDQVDGPYFGYALRKIQPQIEAMGEGATGQTELSCHRLGDEILVGLPPLPIQRKIAAALAAYDELIENNLRRIEILEEMAQAIYREWFVNFRYPGHKADDLVASPLGPIPEGWEVTRLGDRLEFAYGKALKRQDRREGDVAVYGSSGVVGWHDRALVEGPGIVVGRKGNVGAVHWSDGDFYPIDTTFFVRTDLPLEYVLRNLRNQNFINSDAAVPGLNRQQAYGNPLLVPGADVLERYDTVVKPLTAFRRKVEQQNANLRATRDLLLPKLVSGAIDVSDLDTGFEFWAIPIDDGA